LTDKIAEKVPGWVEKFLLPNLESRVQSIVQKEVERLMRIEEKINSIDKRLMKIENNPFIVASANLSVSYASKVLEEFEKKQVGNPLTPYEVQRRRQLTEKLEARTIDPDEAKELHDILNKELQEARATGNFLAVLMILFLLGLVIAFLSE